MNADDERLGQLVRLLRRECGLTQVELSNVVRVPLRDVKLVESGRASDVRLGRIRSMFEALDGRARLVPWWKGAAVDRLLDRRHAAVVERVVALLRARGWDPHVEFSFSEYGERGSIDVLGAKPSSKAVAVCEIKSVIGSLEETNRMLDVKERLAPTIVYKRFGWRPEIVGRVLVLPRDTAARGIIAAHSATIDSLYPARGREIRAWLRNPSRSLRGIWFVSDGLTGAASSV
jgi:hypothetical protein